jgi:hypothetical protein
MKTRAILAGTLLAGTALLTACGGLPQGGDYGAHGAPSASGLRSQHRAWMDASLAKQDLLYVSNGNGEVTVYRYWLHTLVGVLTNFTQPMGECVDAKSNVYITDYSTKQILEFSHGGTKPFKKLNDAPDSPYTCYVDPATGNLAVANNDGTSKEGNIAIWSKGSGQPTRYSDSQLYNFEGCAYDANGNLLVTNGGTYSVPTRFAWLPKGGSQLINISVPGPNPSFVWRYVGGIQWDGKYYVLDGYYAYRISLIHGQAYYVGESQIGTGGPYWIYDNKPGQQGSQLVSGDYSNSVSAVDYWHYPSGGSAFYSLRHGVDRPFGVTVSLRTQ